MSEKEQNGQEEVGEVWIHLFDANLDFFNLHGQQSQIKCFSRSSNLLFNQLLTLESLWIVLSEYTRLVFSLSYAGQGGFV